MNKENLRTYWKHEEERVFKGWDFSSIADKSKSDNLPWDYENIVRMYLKTTDQLLDMGTGGGEFLLTLGHPYHLTSVTEAYPPNVQLCLDKLAPLGISVKGIEDGVDINLPFEDESFDIIINRHESYNLDEIYRLLKPEGIFITQQVGEKNNADLATWLLGEAYQPGYCDHSLEEAVSDAKRLGLECLKQDQFFPVLKFYDVGAFVYFAKIIEWEFTGFSVDQYLDKLYELEKKVQEDGYFTSREQRYMVVLKK